MNGFLKVGAVVLGTAFGGAVLLSVAENSLRDYDQANCERVPENCPINVGQPGYAEFIEHYGPQIGAWAADVAGRLYESPSSAKTEQTRPYDEVGMQIILSDSQKLTP